MILGGNQFWTDFELKCSFKSQGLYWPNPISVGDLGCQYKIVQPWEPHYEIDKIFISFLRPFNGNTFDVHDGNP
jgi:hypothetical protein